MFIFLVTDVNRENVTQAHFHTCKKNICTHIEDKLKTRTQVGDTKFY